MKDTKRRKTIALILVAVILVSITVSFAYFTSGISNDRAQASVLKTGTMALTFDDDDNGINAELDFGSSITKKFKIINTGSLDASLSLDFNQLINTYLNGSLSYNLTYSPDEDGSYEEVIPETNMPTSTEPLTQTLAGELSVPAGETYYYNLTITLNYTDFDQTDDKDAIYNTRFSVGEPIKYRYYTLSVDPNGGTWGEYTSAQEYLLKNKETLTVSTIPTRTGYTFTGWKVSGVSSMFSDDIFTMGIGDSKLVAEWTPKKYTLSINPNGGVYSGDTSVELEYNTATAIEEPTREGYTFTGWTPVGGLVEGNKFTLMSADNASLTANWILNNYKYIVYHNKQNITDDNYTLVSADTDEGEAAFNTTINPEVKTYTGFNKPGQKSLTIKHETVYPPVLNKVEYNYDRGKYTLTIDANGESYTGSMSQELKYEQSVTLEIPSKTGYNFTNWTTTSGVIDGSVFKMGTSDATVTANYTPKEFTVTFNANGGTTPTASKTVIYDSTYGDLPTPTYTGYKFVGWFTESSGGTQVTAGSTISITANQTLFAHWQKVGTQETIRALKITPKTGNPTFENAATTDEGVYSLLDDYGTSYYYRGAVTNNYVKFGGFYWRIIRINGDGSIRMMYDGTQAWPNGNGAETFTTSGTDRFTHINQAWNPRYFNDAKYVGYMYGGTNGSASTQKDGTTSTSATYNETESNVKTQVDAWYKANIADKDLSKYVSDEIFCNDRSTAPSGSTWWTSENTINKGFGICATTYGARHRLLDSEAQIKNPEPTFKCSQRNDAFTVDETTKGNSNLIYPVGVITADETIAAGSGKIGNINRYYYLYKSSALWYWTLSPSVMIEDRQIAAVFCLGESNMNLGSCGVNDAGSVAPVINIAPEYAATMTGSGTMDSPYQILGVD